MKFGGTCLESAESVKRVVAHVRREQDNCPVLVFSAIGKTTQALLNAALLSAAGKSADSEKLCESINGQHRLLRQSLNLRGGRQDRETRWERMLAALLDKPQELVQSGRLIPEKQDAILALGELMATDLMEAVLLDAGIQAQWLDARQFIVTTAEFTHASPLTEETAAGIQDIVGKSLESGRVPVLQGFIGATPDGKTTTLGFEGSDYTAALAGAALKCSEIQIYKTVSGIMTADPALVPEAKSVGRISFQEAAELSYYGAKVLHPATIEPARRDAIPIGVYDLRKSGKQGTLIGPDAGTGARTGNGFSVKSVTHKKPLIQLTLHFAEDRIIHQDLPLIYDLFDERGLIPLILAMEKRSMIAAFPAESADPALTAALETMGPVHRYDDKASLTVIGRFGTDKADLTTGLEDALGDIRIEAVSDLMSTASMTILVDGKDAGEAVRRVHRALCAL